jgi:hypothetical protein
MSLDSVITNSLYQCTNINLALIFVVYRKLFRTNYTTLFKNYESLLKIRNSIYSNLVWIEMDNRIASYPVVFVSITKNRYAVAYMVSTCSKTKNVNAVRFIFTFPTLEWISLKYLGKYLTAH